MNKIARKAQITVFIILGIVILISMIVGIFYFKIGSKKEVVKIEDELSKLTSEFQPVKIFVQSCIKKTSEDAIVFTGLQGGMYDTFPNGAYDLGIGVKMPYYFHRGDPWFPEIEDVEREMGEYIAYNFPVCINDFQSMKDMGFNIEHESSNATVVLRGDNVRVIIDMPTTLQVGDVRGEARFFVEEYDFNFTYVFDTIEKVYAAHKNDPNAVPLSDIAALAEKKDFWFEAMYLTRRDVAYAFYFKNVSIRGSHYVFSFAGRYDWANLHGSGVEEIAQVKDVPEITVFVGEGKIVQIEASEPVTYSTMSTLIEVSPDGVISVIPPGRNMIGTHYEIIQATNEKGGVKALIVKINVIEKEVKPIFVDLQDEYRCSVGQRCSINIKAEVPDGMTVFYYSTGMTINPATGEGELVPARAGVQNIKVTAMNVEEAVYTEEYIKVVSE